MLLAALKAAGLALVVLTVGLRVYLANHRRAPEADLPGNVWATPRDAPLFEIAWMPGGDALQGMINASTGVVDNVATYRLGQKSVSRLAGYRSASAIAVAREGAVFIGTERGEVYRFENGRPTRVLKASGAKDPAIQCLVALDDGRVAVGCGASICLVDARGKLLWTDEIVWPSLNSLSASADGQILVAGSHWNRIAVIDVCTGRIVNVIETGFIISTTAISPDGSHVYAGGLDGTLTAWKTRTGEIEWMRSCGDQTANRIDVSPDGRLIAAGGWNDAVTVWGETGDLVATLPVPHASAVRFSPDSQSLAVSTQAGGVQVIPLVVRF